MGRDFACKGLCGSSRTNVCNPTISFLLAARSLPVGGPLQSFANIVKTHSFYYHGLLNCLPKKKKLVGDNVIIEESIDDWLIDSAPWRYQNTGVGVYSRTGYCNEFTFGKHEEEFKGIWGDTILSFLKTSNTISSLVGTSIFGDGGMELLLGWKGWNLAMHMIYLIFFFSVINSCSWQCLQIWYAKRTRGRCHRGQFYLLVLNQGNIGIIPSQRSLALGIYRRANIAIGVLQYGLQRIRLLGATTIEKCCCHTQNNDGPYLRLECQQSWSTCNSVQRYL